MAADRVPVRQVLAHKKRRKDNLTVIAASGLHKAKGGHYDGILGGCTRQEG